MLDGFLPGHAHDDSFDGIDIEETNRQFFERISKESLEYYDED